MVERTGNKTIDKGLFVFGEKKAIKSFPGNLKFFERKSRGIGRTSGEKKILILSNQVR